MPRVFSIDQWVIYFWSNENVPVEPVHVHVALKRPVEKATKLWITRAGGCVLANNDSAVPPGELRGIMEIVSARHHEIVDKWVGFFGEASYFC